jgi:hypothetical protein
MTARGNVKVKGRKGSGMDSRHRLGGKSPGIDRGVAAAPLGRSRRPSRAVGEEAVRHLVVLVSVAFAPAPLEPDELTPAEQNAVDAVRRMGGKVTIDKDATGKPVVGVRLSGEVVADAQIARIKGLVRLQSLELVETAVTDKGLEHLEGFKQLRRLDLCYAVNVTDAGLGRLKVLNQLEELSLFGVPITDAGVKRLANCEQLRVLILRDTKVTDAGLAYLKDLKLRELSLAETGVTDAGLKHLGAQKELQALDLKETHITDAGLEHLKGLGDLRQLCLYATRTTEDGLQHLSGLENLETLWVWSISDKGLTSLKGLRKLQMLRLGRCTITQAGIADLRRSLPDLKVREDFPPP